MLDTIQRNKRDSTTITPLQLDCNFILLLNTIKYIIYYILLNLKNLCQEHYIRH